MGVRIIEGHLQGYEHLGRIEVLYDSVTDWAFGPVISNDYAGIEGETSARGFLDFLRQTYARDPRLLPDSELEALFADYLRAVRAARRGKGTQG